MGTRTCIRKRGTSSPPRGDHDYDPVELNPGGTKNGSVCFETDGAPGEYTFEFTEGLSLNNETATWKTTL